MLAKGQLQSLIKVVRHFCWHFLFTPSEAIAFCSLFLESVSKERLNISGCLGFSYALVRRCVGRQEMQGREKRNIDLVAHGGDENMGDVSESAKKALFNEGFYLMEKKYLSFTSNSLIEIDHRDSQKRNTKKRCITVVFVFDRWMLFLVFMLCFEFMSSGW